MKYKIGDKVEIISDEHLMFSVTIGKEYEIIDIVGRKIAIINDSRNKQYFLEETGGITLVNKFTKNNKFTKKDLKAGYLLEFENDTIGILVPLKYCGKETLAYVNDFEDRECQQIYDYAENLEEWGNLIRVEGLPKTGKERAWNSKNVKNRNVLWEKTIKTKEMTVAEIEGLLGHKVKIVK